MTGPPISPPVSTFASPAAKWLIGGEHVRRRIHPFGRPRGTGGTPGWAGGIEPAVDGWSVSPRPPRRGPGHRAGSISGPLFHPEWRSDCETPSHLAAYDSVVGSTLVRLRLANREFRQAERKLDQLCAALGKEPPDAEDGRPGDAAILASLPGVGRSTLATLLTEAAGPLGRRDRAALRTLSGVAPVTKRSGKACIVVMRYAAQVRLRQAVFHWARVSVRNDPKCRSRALSHETAAGSGQAA